MRRRFLRSKIHRATVTDAHLNYEGSISICPKLIEAADLAPFEVVDVYNLNNGARFTTYVIVGKEGEICLNGAAARLVHLGDLVIIVNYADFEESEIKNYQPKIVHVDEKNRRISK